MGAKAVLGELKKGAPAYLFHAEDPFLLKEAFLAVKKSVPEGERDFSFLAFDMGSPDGSPPVERIVDALNTVPFFGGRQMVAIENAQAMGAGEAAAMAAYISNPSPHSALLLFYAGAVKKHHRDGLKAARQVSLDVRDIRRWLAERAGERGLSLSHDAAEFLIETVGPEPGLLASELEKLAVVGKKVLGREDVSEAVTGSGDYNAFALVDALKRRDAGEVFRIYRALPQTQEFQTQLMGALNWHYGRAAGGRGKKRSEVFELLNEADTLVKSTGGTYPVEALLFRLLRV